MGGHLLFAFASPTFCRCSLNTSRVGVIRRMTRQHLGSAHVLNLFVWPFRC